jgi:putative hydrolase of the HAD superfamily
MKSVQEYISTRRALFFDLFHTLTGPESGWAKIPMTSELLGISKEDWNKQLLENTRDRLVGELKDPFEIIKKMAHAVNPGIPDKLIRETTILRMKRFASALRNIPEENMKTLVELKKRGKKIGLVSNADVSEIASWKDSPLYGLFDSTIFSCEVGMVKPERNIYELGLTQLQMAAKDCAFIGDGGSDELSGARQVGLGAIMITGVIRELWPERIEVRKKDADFCIEKIPELISNR